MPSKSMSASLSSTSRAPSVPAANAAAAVPDQPPSKGKRRGKSKKSKSPLAVSLVGIGQVAAVDLAGLVHLPHDAPSKFISLSHGTVTYPGLSPSGTRVAVKFARQDLPRRKRSFVESLSKEATFLMEMKVAGGAQHFVDILSSHIHPSFPVSFLVQEYSPHGTLHSVIFREPLLLFPEAKMWGLVLQIAKGIQFLNFQGYIHSGLQNKTVVVEELDGEGFPSTVRLTGLESVKRLSDRSRGGNVAPFSAPERHVGPGESNSLPQSVTEEDVAKCDVFSLAVILQSLLLNTPRPPEDWKIDNNASKIRNFVDTPELASLVSKMCRRLASTRCSIDFVISQLSAMGFASESQPASLVTSASAEPVHANAPVSLHTSLKRKREEADEGPVRASKRLRILGPSTPINEL